ncbi:MAG: EcsC family protein, partial [Paracoccus sp. (in: a-proteobacteria)]
LALRYRGAAGPLMRVIARIGRGAGAVALPGAIGGPLDRAARAALERAWRAANVSRGLLRNRGDRFNRLATTLAGAAGGAAGIAGALAELPVTITLLTRAMLDIADEHGLDTNSEEVRLECLRIFAAAGPMSDPDGPAMGLPSLGVPLAGQTAQGVIAHAAPRLAAVLGQKLAAQSAPVIGALAGAAINHGFVSYYQDLARVHFGLIRLSQETGLPPEALAEALRLRLSQP